MIRLDLKEKSFTADSCLLRDLQLEVAAGEFVALMGPSGIGKTTLLRILSGLDTDFLGHLEVEDAARRVGFLFQEPRLMPWLTVRGNVDLVSVSKNGTEEALQAVDMLGSADLYPHQLSGGMQRRVALARAMAREPGLLILDEPFVSLDQPAAEELHQLLMDYQARARLAVLLVSHNLDEAIALADRLVFIGGKPASIIHEVAIELPRPRQMSAPATTDFRGRLMADYPRLLAGDMTPTQTWRDGPDK